MNWACGLKSSNKNVGASKVCDVELGSRHGTRVASAGGWIAVLQAHLVETGSFRSVTTLPRITDDNKNNKSCKYRNVGFSKFLPLIVSFFVCSNPTGSFWRLNMPGGAGFIRVKR